MIIRITQGLECDQGVEHRRKDRCQAVRTLEALEHPELGFLERAFSERMNIIFGEPFGEFVKAIQPKEEIAPREQLEVRRRGQVAFVNAFGVKFVEGDVIAERTSGLEVIND